MRPIVIAAFGAIALMAGSAHAGGGCNYGKHTAQLAEAEVPATDAAGITDPELLAKLKEQEENEALEKLVGTPVIHN